MKRWGLLAVAMVTAAGCSAAPRPTSAVLLTSPGQGYHLSSVSGPLTKSALSVATPVPHGAMAAYLSSVQFERASERIWTSHEDGFVTDIVVEVGDPASAARLVGVATSALAGDATSSFDLGLGGGRGFVQTSDVHGQAMFCVFAVLPVGDRAFVLTRCTPYPQDTTTVARLARDQRARARARGSG